MRGRILITPRSLSNGHAALAPLTEAGFQLVMPSPGATPSEEVLARAVPGCVGWLAGVEKITPHVIAAATELRVVSRNGTGIDNLPLPALEARGITICRAEGANAQGVAELALTLSLVAMRQVIPTHTGMKAGHWPRQIGRELRGARVAVIGLGAIGAGFAEACLALGAQVAGFDPFANAERVRHPNFTRTGLTEALSGAELVSLHAPLPADGRALIQAPQLALMAPCAVLVNTARAGLVHGPAALEALETGQLSAYATDAYDTEPPRLDALLSHPRTILTSHIGGYTSQSVERATEVAVRNLLEALDAA